MIEKILKIAKSESFSKTQRPGKAHVCACAIKGRTFWLGYNKQKSHPSAKREYKHKGTESCFLHAEIDAIVKVPRDTRAKIKLFVFRFLKDGTLSMAKPCDMCQNYLKQQGIKNVIYTNWGGQWTRL